MCTTKRQFVCRNEIISQPSYSKTDLSIEISHSSCDSLFDSLDDANTGISDTLALTSTSGMV